jgi:hypothetical protein
MAEQNIDIKIKVDKQGNVELKSLEKGFDKVKITAKQASQAAKQLGVDISQIKSSGTINVAANDFNKLTKAMSGASAASGGATASVLELGRVVSDMPYGIRGVANNLQQLASNFAFMVKEAGGAGAALKTMGSVLMGPLGILVAFQAVIAALDYFSANIKKAENQMAKFNAEAITENVTKLHILKDALSDNNVALEDKISLLRKAGTEFEELNGFISDGAINMDAFNKTIDKMILKMSEVAFAKAVLAETQEITQELVRTIAKGADGDLNLLQKKAGELFSIFNPFGGDNMAAKRLGVDINKIEEQRQRLLNIMKTDAGSIKGIFAELIFGKEDKSGSGERTKMLKQQLLDFSKLILDAYKKQALMLEENEIKKMELSQDYEKQELERRRDVFLKRQEQRKEDFIKKAKNDEEIAQANKVWRDSQTQAKEQYEQALTALEVKHTAQRKVKMLELERNFAEQLVNQRLARIKAEESMFASLRAGTKAGMLNRPMSAVGAEDIETQNQMARDRMAAEQANFEDDLERKIENLKRQGHSLLEAEQMVAGERHAFQMSQAEQEIELERNKIEAKRNINQEYISWFAGLGSIMKGIAGDNEDLATAALVLEKGSAIANVIVSTQAANAKIGANMLAEQSAFKASAAATSLVMPKLAATFTKMAISAGVLGKKRILKNNIGAGISIAKIAATTLQSRGAGGGGAGGGGEAGGGAPSREFDFNLVGSTGVNQLAQGVGAQFSQQPIQAYVVSSQMTSQQQLDHTIQTQASIGD